MPKMARISYQFGWMNNIKTLVQHRQPRVTSSGGPDGIRIDNSYSCTAHPYLDQIY